MNKQEVLDEYGEPLSRYRDGCYDIWIHELMEFTFRGNQLVGSADLSKCFAELDANVKDVLAKMTGRLRCRCCI